MTSRLSGVRSNQLSYRPIGGRARLNKRRVTAKRGCPVVPRKEVIQPQLPLQLPCYDFVPVTRPPLGGSLLAVGLPTSGVTSSHDVTGGVYKARERIHRAMLMRGY